MTNKKDTVLRMKTTRRERKEMKTEKDEEPSIEESSTLGSATQTWNLVLLDREVIV